MDDYEHAGNEADLERHEQRDGGDRLDVQHVLRVEG